MKPIEMPASRLTADCIWSSFRSSHKRHLILTGSRHTGKSTLLSRLFPHPLPGLTTVAEPGAAVILKENLTGRQGQIGIFDPALPGPGNQMVPCPEGFLSLGIPALTRCVEHPGEWITIDEIGYLETGSLPYRQALLSAFEKKRVAAVVRKQALPFLQALCAREDAFVVDLDHPFGNMGCVIMASGMGIRFGGNKLMADFCGEPMICRILNATEGIFARRVVVTRHEDVARLCESRGIQTVLHHLPHRSDTVRLGLEAMPRVEGCMFCPADQPLLRRDTVAALALAGAADPDSLWRTQCGSELGSPVIFPRWTFPELLTLPEGKGGSVITKKYPERLRTVSVRDPYELKDVDSPMDLSELVER